MVYKFFSLKNKMLEPNISCKNIFTHFMRCLVNYNKECEKIFKTYNQCIEELGDV